MIVFWLNILQAMVNEYDGLTFKCSPADEAAGECVFETGEDILYLRGLEDIKISECIYLLIVMQAAYRIVGFVAFWLLFRNQSPMTIIRTTFGCSK